MTDEEYEEEVEAIRLSFEFELCAECEGDLNDHDIAPEMFGHAHAWCKK